MDCGVIWGGDAPRYFVLKGREVLPAESLQDWTAGMATPRHIGRAVAMLPDGEVVTVSTVFLGIAHGYRAGVAVLFESMVFGSPFDQECVRFCTYEEAEAGHAEMCRRLNEAMGGALLFFEEPKSIAGGRNV